MVNVLKLNWTGAVCKVSGRWISVFFDTLHANSRGVTSMIDLSEIEDFTCTFFKQVEVGIFQSNEIPPSPKSNDRISFCYSNIRPIFEYSVPSLVKTTTTVN